MKKILIISGILLAGLLTSCEGDFLDAPAISTLEESVIFSNPDLARGAIDGIKEPFGGTDSYRGRFIPYYGLNTDIEWNLNSDKNDAKADLSVYDAKPNNSEMNKEGNVWSEMYRGIERANIAIRGLRTYGNPQPGTELGQLLGEALTLRAIYYADLTKAWGDVPVRFEPINTETIYIEKSSRDIVYKQIIQDLEEASTLVAWPNETSATKTVEQINKAFVKAFRARLALAASGFQQYPDAVRRSTDPDLSVAKMYKIALDETRDVIASGKAKLEPSFETFWKNYNKEIITAGGESLWEIPFSATRGRVLYTFAVRHRGINQYTGQAKGGSAGPLPTVFYDFDELDSRRDVSCVPYEWGNPVDEVSQQQLTKMDTWYFGKYRYEWMTRRVTSSNDDGVNKIYMRYAEVLLIAAEAANELEGYSAAAPYLKEVRSRAFLPQNHTLKVDAYVNAINSKEDMFKAIVNEHKFEFVGEMERKQALIRWNLLKKNLDEAKVKMTNLEARTGEYANVPTNLYYKYKADNETLDVYGLNRGETTAPSDPEYSLFERGTIKPEKIDALFKTGINPDDRQFWPIWQVFLDGSNGKLKNDYNY